MNKRLLHLFNEAGFHQPEMERLGIEHKFEKFAELIVKECAGVAEVSMPVNSHPDVRLKVKNSVLKHFGVK